MRGFVGGHTKGHQRCTVMDRFMAFRTLVLRHAPAEGLNNVMGVGLVMLSQISLLVKRFSRHSHFSRVVQDSDMAIRSHPSVRQTTAVPETMGYGT